MKTGELELYRLFKARYEELAGRVHLAEDRAAAVALALDVVQSARVTRAVLGRGLDWLAEGLQGLGEGGPALVTPGGSAAEILRQVDSAELGFSVARFAIAFTGTIVEVTTDDRERLVSSMPRIHVAFLPAAEIIEQLDDAASRLRQIYRTHPRGCNITFISGPSRTADVEMKLVLGVHGPQESHVIVCDWEMVG
ncbi:MAG: hypothetical protein D6743_07890 [Calditrichaeota bacterium]|nr:MAG: hypothetical protein D6743_07890 [Calditrichota bacterium]